MVAIRYPLIVVAMAILALAVGCSGPVTTPTPTPTPAVRQVGPPVPSAPVATIALAQAKSVTQATPIASGPISGPRLAIDVQAVDFGDVPYLTVAAFSFNIKNVGAAPISLGPAFIRVKEGC